MKTPFLETGFLITKEDFVYMTLDVKKYNTPKENTLIMRILGFIAVCCGVAAYIEIGGNIYQQICWLVLIAIGLFALFYYDVINPSMLRKQAKNYFNFNENSIGSRTVRLYDDFFEINSETYKVSVPKKYIYKIVESKHTILIFLDKNEYCFIPKRIFSDDKLEELHSFLDSEKYVKL